MTERIGVDPRSASDALRSELIFLPDDGSIRRIDRGFALLTPSNPGYWWGNSLRFDHAPSAGDFERWMRSFEDHVHAVQPASSHRTFGWDGDECGAIDRFVDAGFAYLETLALAVGQRDPVVAPHRPAVVKPRRIAGDDWSSLLALLVETRDPKHSAPGHRSFSAARIAGWQTLEARGQGAWFAIGDGRVDAALGVFAERERGLDGRRIGRFQQVVTHPTMRRRGLCGTLVEHASRFAFTHLDIDVLHLHADENDAPRRIYEALAIGPSLGIVGSNATVSPRSRMGSTVADRRRMGPGRRRIENDVRTFATA